MRASLESCDDASLDRVARALLAHCPPAPAERNKIEDLLWADERRVVIPKRFRRELADALESCPLWLDSRRFSDLLDSLWVLDDASPYCGNHGFGTLRHELEQHLFTNRDLSPDQLFDAIGAYDTVDHRFALFVEGLASPLVRPDVESQRAFVDVVNKALKNCGVELQETGEDGGYPTFRLASRAAARTGRPKNLIFASSTKPDLRFRDAVNNDIEIVTNADKVLIYDRPIGVEGIRWRDLQTWWAETRGIQDPKQAKETLYRRLQESLPESSPPQQAFFRMFHKIYGARIPDLPALLPEVWLHWDPKTVKERGPDALARFRMDFLLLFPANVRVVIEIDGKEHYGDSKGQVSPGKYAEMVAADRELRLSGYEVYRFGAAEVGYADAGTMVQGFFDALFKKHT